MVSVMRFRVAEPAPAIFQGELTVALDRLRAQRGFVRGHIARAVDDAHLWVLATEWEGVGAYRRALSSYDVKVNAVPVLSCAIDEPNAFEVLESRDR